MLHHKHNQLVAEYSVSKAKGPAMDQQKSPAFNGTRYTTKKNAHLTRFLKSFPEPFLGNMV